MRISGWAGRGSRHFLVLELVSKSEVWLRTGPLGSNLLMSPKRDCRMLSPGFPNCMQVGNTLKYQ